MADYKATVPSTWSQEQTFDYLADFRSVAEWDPSMESAELLSGEPGRVGAVYRLTMSMAGRSMELEYKTIEVQRPERIVLRCETDSAVLVDTITVAGDSTVTYHADIDLRGVRKIADPLASIGLSRAGDQAREGLEEKLASQPKA